MVQEVGRPIGILDRNHGRQARQWEAASDLVLVSM